MTFEFASAARIVFGPGTLDQVGQIASEFGGRALVVTGANPDRAARLLQILASAGIQSRVFTVPGEPTLSRVAEGVQAAEEFHAQMVVSFGGGAAIDAGKAIAALRTNPGSALDYLEVIGKAEPLEVPPKPFIAIPTTAGAGAEVTRNAVLTSPEHRSKASIRHAWLLPKVALVDPLLTLGLPRRLTASTGLDALTQLVEPFLSCKANPLTDALCREALPKAAKFLPKAFRNGQDIEARHEMALASLSGGLALANAGLGVVHGFAAPIGGMFPAAHGAVCAALLPAALETNLRVLRERHPASQTLVRFAELAVLLTGRGQAAPEDAVRFVKDLAAELGAQPLGALGIAKESRDEVLLKAAQTSSMRGNPVPLRPEDLGQIFDSSL